MKRSFIVVAALLLLVGGFSAAEESVLIDFNLLSADIIEETDAEGNSTGNMLENRRTVMDFSTVAGASFTETQKSLMKTSLAHGNWEVVLNSSAQNPDAMSVSYAREAPVSQNATNFAGEHLIGVRVHFPTWNNNANAVIQPPFDIPAYEAYAQVSDDGVVQEPTEEDREAGITRFEEGYGVVKNVSVIKSIAVNAYGLNFPHGLYVLLKDQNNVTSRYFMGYLNFDGWKQMVWVNPDYITDVRAREVRVYPVYPTAMPYQKFAGFLITRDAAHEGGDFVAYFKDVKIIYDRAVLDSLRDFEHEDLWGIQTQRDNERKRIEVSRFGNTQVNRFMERERMATEAGYTADPGTGPGGAGEEGGGDAAAADDGVAAEADAGAGAEEAVQ